MKLGGVIDICFYLVLKFQLSGKGVKVIFWGVQRGWELLYNPMGKLKFRSLMLITSKWIMIETSNLT